MGSQVIFSTDDVRELRGLLARARSAAALPDLHPWGWSVDLVDPERIVEAFGVFRTAAGRRWTTAHHRGEEGTRSWVWAIPEDAPALDVGDWPPPHETEVGPVGPRGATPDPMDAVEGERSEWTLLCASLLARELAEAGGTGGYRKWGKHDLLAGNPWDTLTPAQVAANHRTFTEGQYWMEDIPSDLRPRVESDGRRTRGHFHTLHRRYHLPVYVHDDVYAERGFRVETGRRLIGRVPYKRPPWSGDVEDPRL